MEPTEKSNERLGMNPDNKRRDILILAACLASFVVIIVFDSLMPVEVDGGVLYIVPVALTIFSSSRRMTYAVTLASSILAPLGYFISSPEVSPYYALFNRFIALFAIWVMAFLVIQRKYAEEALKQANEELEQKVQERTKDLSDSEAKYRGLFDNMQELVLLGRIVYDEKDEIVDRELIDANPAALKAMGVSSIDDIRGRKDSEMYSPETAAWGRYNTRRMRAAGEAITEEMHLDYGGRDYLTTSVPLGKEHILSTSVDITDHKKAEKALRESEQRLRFHVENSPMAVVEWDANFIVTRWAGEAEKIFGWSSTETVGRPIMDLNLIYPDDIPIVEGTIAKLTDGISRQVVSSNRNITKGGRVIYCTWYNSVLMDDSGRMTSVLSLVLDNTYRVKAEENLTRSNAELQQFAYVASHDLQEPLRMVTAYLGLLEKKYADQLDEKAKQYMDFAIEGGLRAKDLIRDLLEFSRVDSQPLSLQSTDMEKVLEQVVISLMLQIQDEHANISHDKLPTVLADEPQMVSVMQNLISNSIKFHGAEPPNVRISCEDKYDRWLFSVTDNGIGIDPKHKDNIFVLFQRLHTRDQYEGTGIGLAISKKVIERHGGKIWFESEVGKGTSFYFTIPKGSMR